VRLHASASPGHSRDVAEYAFLVGDHFCSLIFRRIWPLVDVQSKARKARGGSDARLSSNCSANHFFPNLFFPSLFSFVAFSITKR